VDTQAATETEPMARLEVVRGRPDPFERLFLAEYGRVAAIAHRVLADAQEAEDVAQEVFIDFHRRHPADAPFAAGWLHAAAAHTALNRIRGRKRRESREKRALEVDTGALDTQRVFEESEQRRQVRTALGRLPGRAAAVLVLRYGGLSYAEVAQAVGIRVGSVGTLLRRAEAALRKEVSGDTSG